jgi:hypothetical protein
MSGSHNEINSFGVLSFGYSVRGHGLVGPHSRNGLATESKVPRPGATSGYLYVKSGIPGKVLRKYSWVGVMKSIS